MWDLSDLPQHIQFAGAYATLPLLTVEGDDSGAPLHFPIAAEDENGQTRPYLPAGQRPGIVIAIFDEQVAWVVPLVTESDFTNLDEARSFIELVQRGKVDGWIYLPPLPGWPASGVIVPLGIPTLLPVELAERLTKESGLAPLGKLSDEGIEALNAALSKLFVAKSKTT
jgi:hypothetical protein